MRKYASLVPALLFVFLLPAGAQEKAASGAVYKVEFRIREGSGAAGQSVRRYSMLIDAGGRGVFRVGDRVPVATGTFQPNSNPAVSTQYNYIDVGVNIDTRLRELDGKVRLDSTVDLSGQVERKLQPGAVVVPAPTIGQLRIVIEAAVVPGTPTLVASIEDPASQHHVEVEAVVTKE